MFQGSVTHLHIAQMSICIVDKLRSASNEPDTAGTETSLRLHQKVAMLRSIILFLAGHHTVSYKLLDRPQ